MNCLLSIILKEYNTLHHTQVLYKYFYSAFNKRNSANNKITLLYYYVNIFLGNFQLYYFDELSPNICLLILVDLVLSSSSSRYPFLQILSMIQYISTNLNRVICFHRFHDI